MANILQQMRRAANLTQEQLADQIGVKRSALAMWEVGDNLPPTKYLVAISEALNCTTDELLGKTTEYT